MEILHFSSVLVQCPMSARSRYTEDKKRLRESVLHISTNILMAHVAMGGRGIELYH